MAEKRSFVTFPRQFLKDAILLQDKDIKVIIESEDVKIKGVKFITSVSSMGKNRIIIMFPEKLYDEGKKMRGKNVKVLIEEIIW